MKKAVDARPNLRLAGERMRREWTQQEVADRIGTTPVNISRWERGITLPGPHFRQKLCTLYEKNLEDLGLVHVEADNDGNERFNAGGSELNAISASSLATHVASNVPQRRNPFFTGREEVLQQLHTVLRPGNAAALTQPQAISGLGGIGKTQTAVEYIYRYWDVYQAVFWVRADTRDILASDFAAIATLLNLSEQHEQDQHRTIQAVKRWLNETADWLLVLDNIEDLTMVNEFLPSMLQGSLLLTTRSQVTGAIAQCIALERMEPEEGALFLLRRSKRLSPDASFEDAPAANRETAVSISRVMDGLPLALDQAGAYIEETACDLSSYLDYYRVRHDTLLNLRGTVVADHPESVAATFSLAIEKVQRANPAAAELLSLCAFLHPDAIPEEMLSDAVFRPDPLRTEIGDALMLDTAIKELRRFSLVRRISESKVLSIHRLVQAVIKDGMEQNTRRFWAEKAVRAVSSALPEDVVTTGQRYQRYLPQAQVGAALIAEWSMLFPEAARLLRQTGRYLCAHAQYADAEPLLRQALVIYE